MTAASLEARLAAGLDALGLQVGAADRARLLRFLDELLRWNRRINLTAITDPEAALAHHLLDSLAVAPWLRGPALLDVGSGGGLPGLPLALVRPELAVTSVDSRHRKIAFQREAARLLGLENFTPLCQRVEQLPADTRYPQIISRAFSSLGRFVELAGPLLAPGGELLAMKGKRPDAELAEVPAGWRLVTMPRLTVPGLGAERHLVILAREASDTPACKPQDD